VGISTGISTGNSLSASLILLIFCRFPWNGLRFLVTFEKLSILFSGGLERAGVAQPLARFFRMQGSLFIGAQEVRIQNVFFFALQDTTNKNSSDFTPALSCPHVMACPAGNGSMVQSCQSLVQELSRGTLHLFLHKLVDHTIFLC
jgi:hypothetical protein